MMVSVKTFVVLFVGTAFRKDPRNKKIKFFKMSMMKMMISTARMNSKKMITICKFWANLKETTRREQVLL